MAEEVTLTYSRARGLGEAIRMLLAAARIKFRENHLRDRDHYLLLCAAGELLYNQTPLLEIDGLKIVQQRACLLYVAKKAGMLGQSDAEFAKILMYFEGTRDAVMAFYSIYFPNTEEEGKQRAQATTIAKYLPIFNKALAENGTGFLVGSSITLADTGLFEVIIYLIDYFGEESLNDLPHLREFNGRMRQDEGISYYLKNLARPKATAELADYVKNIYSHVELKF